ncbi:hypothetical protein KC480_05440 [Bacillus velezensis]|uniref:hypothetical protein n=1 Tax=Bacillus velezensis TaxID=492670 RepID=UPI001E62477D|nr:hypothetical protein [Bacillus velezensis]MCD7910968.1 hypothetical protein [Bacillus velezensis]
MLESLFSKQIIQPFLKEIPSLESLFSQKVTQHYILNEDFPLHKRVLDERVFRHITFMEDDPDLKIRLRSVDHNGISQNETSIMTQKKFSFDMGKSNAERFRLKAVLSQEDHGVLESYWITENNAPITPAASFNQYRLRGISSKGLKSDWVYSNAKNDKNDTIIYNMIYDVLDVMLNIYDEQMDLLTDHMITETFLELIKATEPGLYKSLEIDDRHFMKLNEVMATCSNQLENKNDEKMLAQLGEKFFSLGTILKEKFKETIFASSDEFTDLYRVYRAVDQYQSRNVDFFTLLVEIFLEDRYEELQKKDDIEAFLINEERMDAFLKGNFNFDIKRELITSASHVSLDDHFVSTLNDAVELLSQPLIYDQLVYDKNETLEKFIRIVMKDLYAPMLAVENQIVTLETELQDSSKQNKNDFAAGYDFTDDYGNEIRNMILFDFVDVLIKGDMEINNDFQLTLIDSIIHRKNDYKKTVMLEYGFKEMLSIFSKIGETFRQSFLSFDNKINDQLTTGIAEKDLVVSSGNITFKDAFTSVFNELHDILLAVKTNIIQENKSTSLNESIKEQFNIFKKIIDDLKTINLKEHSYLSNTKHYSEFMQCKNLGITEGVLNKHTLQSVIADKRSLHHKEQYYNLFKHYLKNPYKFPLLDKRFVKLSHELKDYLLIDWTDNIQYALGDMDNGWTLGVFKLGINTLKGEE